MEELNRARKSKPPVIKKEKINKPIKGSFDISGWKYVKSEVIEKMKKELNDGDEVQLVPDVNNKYDNFAIKIMWKNNQIGWYSKSEYRKRELFRRLLNGNSYTCIFYWYLTPKKKIKSSPKHCEYQID